MPNDDGWDWPWLLFISRKELCMSEIEFWRCTPRKFSALMNCALTYRESQNNPSEHKNTNRVVDGYVDDINW